MTGTRDLTDIPPVRRMAVARGRLAGVAGTDDQTRGHATAAAVLAVKEAARIVPLLDAFQPTHVDVLWGEEGDATVCTVTVLAFARASLGHAALLGVAAGLLAVARDGEPHMELAIVQNVQG